jgi:hypothetical protein
MLLPAVFKPSPSLDARAVVRPLWEAVKVDALRPKVIPLALLNVIADNRFEVVPADTLMLLMVAALLCIAVVR